MPNATSARILLRPGYRSQQDALPDMLEFAAVLAKRRITARYGVFISHIGGGAGWGVFLRDRQPDQPPPHLLDVLMRAA